MLESIEHDPIADAREIEHDRVGGAREVELPTNSLTKSRLYTETISLTTVEIRDRRTQVRYSTHRGTTLEISDPNTGTKKVLYATDGQLPSLQEATLKPQDSSPLSLRKLETERSHHLRNLEAKLPKLQQFARQLWPEDSRLCHAAIYLLIEFKAYEIKTPHSTHHTGQEVNVSLKIEWQIKKDNETVWYEAEELRTSPDELLEDSQALERLNQAVQKSLSTTPPWPAPYGNLPVLWSSHAVAKLTHTFLQTFEGDRVLAQQSFLNHWPEGDSFQFTLEESPKVKNDYEGSPTKAQTIFDGMRPRGLFVDKTIAEKMNVASTGHCRRTSFKEPATVCFWSAKIIGKNILNDFKPHLDCGLHVKDLEVLKFEPLSGNVTLQFTDAFLLHLGQTGERIETLAFELPLFDILLSWKWFSPQTQVSGLPLRKLGQTFLCEITSSSAVSERLTLPGQVPAAHYW